jgi:hypothetical protein
MNGFTYNAPRLAMVMLASAAPPTTAPMIHAASETSYTVCNTSYYKREEYYEPEPDFINGSLIEFYRPPKPFTQPQLRRYNYRSAPRWPRGRWKAKT